jgi:excisionase family DNA binding protein
MLKQLLNTKEAANYLGVSKSFLDRDRCYDARIPHIKMGTRTVRYRLTDLNAFIEKQFRRSTSHKVAS